MDGNLRYPCLVINLRKLGENIKAMREFCEAQGVEMAGVIKGFSGITECVREYEKSGVSYLASSRLGQLARVKEAGIRIPTMCIRISMLSEVSDLVRYADCSLQSEESVLRAIDQAAQAQNKIHDVILMADLGDLREGFWTTEDLVSAALLTEKELPNVRLLGVATNLGCYGSVEATPEKMEELIERAEAVEAAIGRKLRYIGGGATTSIPRLFEHNMPKRINLLRIGEAAIYARDLPDFFALPLPFLHNDAFVLKAEIIEVKTKASHPVGNITVDAFGRRNEYEDRGMRKRALAAVGKVDYGDPFDLIPREAGIEVIGASSDHTILDVENCGRDLQVGDIVEFDVRYGTGVYLTSSEDVKLYFE